MSNSQALQDLHTRLTVIEQRLNEMNIAFERLVSLRVLNATRAIQDQEIESLKAEIAALRAEVSRLKKPPVYR